LRECEPVLQSAWAVFNETFGEAQSQTRKLAKRLADVRARLGGNDANHAPAKTPS
jgi:hypothetical protein